MIRPKFCRLLNSYSLKSYPFTSVTHLPIVQLTTARNMSGKGNPSDAKIEKFFDVESKDAKWVKLQKIHYFDPSGKARDWEMASRTTRQEDSTVDGVGIIALIETENGPQIVLQKQFRPPVEGVCIEIPAGLVDPKESLETCALRELKEETGYIGTHVNTTRVMFNDPGFTNTNLVLVTVKVDLEDDRNKHPEPELEENEYIETFTVPLKDLPEEMDKFADQGYKLDARLACVAHGITVARQFVL